MLFWVTVSRVRSVKELTSVAPNLKTGQSVKYDALQRLSIRIILISKSHIDKIQ